MDIREVERLKTKIERAKNNMAELKGQKISELARLKELGCETLEAGEIKVKKLDIEIALQTPKLEKAFKKLNSDFTW